ncbi:MAG: hypothetical protein V1674_01050 [Candidatus Omnitrophota bacterium]
MDREEKLLETYKIARNSVEHFDKILGVFRQIIFTFNAVFSSSSLAFYLNYFFKQAEPTPNNATVDATQSVLANSKIYAILFVAATILASINILVWMLEKHYHRYLVVSALVADNFEQKLFPHDAKKHLTYQLHCAHQWRFPFIGYIIGFVSKFIRSYDLLYLLPIAGVVFVSNFLLEHSYLLNKEMIEEFSFLQYCYWLPSFYVVICVILILFNWDFVKKFKLSEKN